MKITYQLAAALAGASLLLSSCVVADGGYGSFGIAASGNGYSASVAWSNASYDANGFPIFGYSYGRPVYGYTAAGAAVFTFAALTALCFVPHWGPAPWYHGSWHYPPRIHRVSAPPRYPHGHMPHMRPQGGMNAPIHHSRPSAVRPASRPQSPVWAGHPHPTANRPIADRPAVHRPAVNKPNAVPNSPAHFNGGNIGAAHKPVHQNNMTTGHFNGNGGHLRNEHSTRVPSPSVQQHRPNMPHASMPHRAAGANMSHPSGAARPALHRGSAPAASGGHQHGRKH